MVRSYAITLLFTILILFFLHLFGSWTKSDSVTQLPYDNYYNRHNDTSIVLVSNMFLACNNKCLLFNKKHETFAYTKMHNKEMDYLISRFKISNALKFAFEDHILGIFIVSLFGMPLAYFLITKRKM